MRRTMTALLLALALPALAATTATSTRSATITRLADLRATPAVDGQLIATLPVNARVDVIKRVGGWYQVKAESAEGWVRMWLVRFSAQATGGDALKQNVAVLQSGRASSTYTTATTGVRGLSEEDLENARPDPKAVQALEKLAVTPEDARKFAGKGGLKADPGVEEAP